jgi:hypothetical protein
MDSEHQAGVQPALTAGFADAARQATDGFVERRKNDVAQAVADLATSIRQAAAGLERRSNIHSIVEAAAEGVEDLSARLRSRPAPIWAAEMEAVVRRHPKAVAVAAASAGLLVAGLVISRSNSLRRGRAGQSYDSDEVSASGPHTARRHQPRPVPLTTAPAAQPPFMTDPDLGVPPRY